MILSAIFRFTAVRWSRWLLQEYHGEAFWESAWPLPALYAAFLVFCMPKEIGVILMNRIRIIAVLAVSISLLGIFLLLYEMYRVAKEYARSSQLDRENQLLAVSPAAIWSCAAIWNRPATCGTISASTCM